MNSETIGFEGWSMRVRLDECTLKEIANRTAADVKKVYNMLSTRFALEKKETEIFSIFALIAAFALVAGRLSLAWFGRVM